MKLVGSNLKSSLRAAFWQFFEETFLLPELKGSDFND
jgi:hypothetical protein